MKKPVRIWLWVQIEIGCKNMSKMIHPSLLLEEKWKPPIKNFLLNRHIVLFQDKSGKFWELRIVNGFKLDVLFLSNADILQTAEDLISLYAAFYYRNGSLVSFTMSYTRQQWKRTFGTWAIEEIIVKFCQASRSLGIEPHLDTKYMLQQKSIYRD